MASDFSFPQFSSAGVPAGNFPYTDLLQQLFASFTALPSYSYGRWNGTGQSAYLGYPGPNGVPLATAAPPTQQGMFGGYTTAQPKSGGGPATPTPSGTAAPDAFMPTPTVNQPVNGAFPVKPLAPGLQATSGLTAGDAAKFGFTIPQGYSTNGGLAHFSYSPSGDQAAANRTISFTDANGNPIAGDPRTGIEAPGYFAVGGPALDRWGRVDTSIPVLQPGQQYFANLSGGNGPAGAANVNYALSLPQHASAPQNPLVAALAAFRARHPSYMGG